MTSQKNRFGRRLAAAAVALAAGSALAARGASFGDARLSVSFDDRTGAVTYAADGEPRLVPDPESPRVAAVVKGGAWSFDRIPEPERFAGVAQGADGVVTATYETGAWRVRVHHALLPEKRMVRRWVTFETTAGEKQKFGGLTLAAGKVVCATPAAGYRLPWEYPPRRRARGDFKPGMYREARGNTASPVVGDDGAGHTVSLCQDSIRPYSDAVKSFVTERADGYRLSTSFFVTGFAHPGKPQQVGDDWLVFGKGTDEDALLALHDWYRAAGLVPPADRPEARMRRQVVYSCHPRGKTEFDFCDEGGFNAAQEHLPFLQALGVKSVWLRPVTWPSCYCPNDLYRLMDGVGTEDDFVSYVRAAHARGMEVWNDAVPHGGSTDGPRAKAHPEFVCKREDGTDQATYWAYDFNWPEWVADFGKWVEWATRRFELDGWRMDVPTGSRFPNWNPAAPYPRASFAIRQGGISQHREIRAAARRANPNAVTLGEENDSLWSVLADSIYDQLLCHVHFHDFRERDAASVVRDLRRWLHDQKCAFVPGTAWMRYPESHDSSMAESLWGRSCATALMALCAWIDGFPLVYGQGEEGAFEAYRRIFAIRDAVPELTLGDADYLSWPASPGVFACVRTLPESQSVVLVNFNDVPADGLPPFGYEVRRLKGAPVESLLKPTRPYVPEKKGPTGLVPAAGGVRLPGGAVAELRDLTNGVVRAPYALACAPDPDGGVRLSVADWGGLKPAEVRLAVRFAGSERWFAHAAEGSFESPYFVWHPDKDAVWPAARGRRRVDPSVRWSNASHPFGFVRRHAEVGATAGDRAVSVTDFAPGVRAELRERLGGERGLALTLASRNAADFACRVVEDPADAASASRGPGTGDGRLRASPGGWTYEDAKLKVRLYNSGAIAGVWTRGADGAWREEVGLSGWRGTKTVNHLPALGWRLRDENASEQAYDCYGAASFARDADGTIRLRFEDVRPKLFSKRYLATTLDMAVDYAFGRDTGEFRTETYFRIARPIDGTRGIWEYRLRRPTGARGTIEAVRFDGKWPVRTEADAEGTRWIYHDAETPDFTTPPGWLQRIGWTFRSR